MSCEAVLIIVEPRGLDNVLSLASEVNRCTFKHSSRRRPFKD